MSVVIVHSGVTEQFGELGGPEVEDEEEEDNEDEEGRQSRLWVDRFSPHHYTELLSDDVSPAPLPWPVLIILLSFFVYRICQSFHLCLVFVIYLVYVAVFMCSLPTAVY